MQMLKTARIFPALLLFVLGGLLPCVDAAADVSVSAELSRPEVNAGEMAELQVKVSGADGAKVPQEITVEGLQIRLTGQSTQVQMVNFQVSSSAVYSYIVMPLRTGKFTIPSILVRTDTSTVQTKPLSFSVVDASGVNASVNSQVQQQVPQQMQPGMPGFRQPRAGARRKAQPDMNHLAFGEINCPKNTLYVGEMVPVEIRFYFDARYPVQVGGRVDFGSEGVLVERFPEPKQSRVERDGEIYNVMTFRTLLSAVKPGQIEIPPAKLPSQIQMPGAMPQGMDDPVFQQLLGGRNPFSESRDVTVQTASLHLNVIPLPKEGRPSSFAGAVGQFDIDAMVANYKPAPGDPAVLSVKIGGKGNFTAMGAPSLTDTDGWRTYPPTDKFESSDELSLTGVKTFDYTLIAQVQKTNSPGSEFSYFDPLAVKYVTLTTKPVPLDAFPAESVSAPVVTQPTSQQGKNNPPNEAVKKGDDDSISRLTLHSWKTPIQRSDFLIATLAMIVATGALAGALHFRNLQSSRGSATARRRRLAELLSSLDSESLDAAATYDKALQYLELLAIPESESIQAEITKRRDLLKYGVGGTIALARNERDQLIETLRTLSIS
jgi:hypothetical protein